MPSVEAVTKRLATFLPGEVAVLALGLCYTTVSVWNFARELGTLTGIIGPILAGVANVGLSLTLVGVGVWLARSSLPSYRRWTVAGWCLFASAVALSVEGFTIAVRLLEGRTVSEPQFSLIVVGSLGGIFGALIGRYAESARERAARARETKDAMAFSNSLLRHDVLNGLQIMRGHAELVADGDDDRIASSGTALLSQVDTLSELLEEVRAVSATLLGDAEKEPIDVVPFLTDAVETTAEAYPDATFETDLPDALVVDGTMALKPVFTNLLNNAVQHTDTGVTVRVTGSVADGMARIGVADDGPGIPTQQRDRILERGVTTDGGDGGLGLHLVSTIVDRTGGSLSVEESDRGGAQFVLELPASDRKPAEDGSPFG